MSINQRDINPDYLRRLGIEAPKTRKYGNKPALYKGILYDSTLEANVAAQLDQLIRAGKVVRWERQVVFEVSPQGAPRKNRVTLRADFQVWYATGQPRVLDAKGVRTEANNIKLKLFEERYGYPVHLVHHYKDTPQEGRT